MNRLRRAVLYVLLLFLVFDLSVGLFTTQPAQAQFNQPEICKPTLDLSNLISQMSVTATFITPYRTGSIPSTLHDIGAKITASLTSGGPVTRVEASIYRATATADTWSKVGTVALSAQNQGFNTWGGEYTGNLPDGAYRLFVLAKGYNTEFGSEKQKTQGCSTAQLVTKGKSEKDKFCDGAADAFQEAGFGAGITVKSGGEATKSQPVTLSLAITLKKGLRNATQPQISVKRAVKGSTHVFTTIQADVPLGNSKDQGTDLKVWTPEVTDSPKNAGEYTYHVFGETTVNGKRYTSCGQIFNRWGNADTTIEDKVVDIATLRKWFGPDMSDLVIKVPTTTPGEKPYVEVDEDIDGTGRPKIRFELAYIFGQGGMIYEVLDINTRQLDFTMFQTLITELDGNNNVVTRRLKGVYYQHNDLGLNGFVEYWENEASVPTRRTHPTETLQEGWDVTKESYTDLYSRLYNDPKDPASENCQDAEGIIKIGVLSKGAEKEKSDRGYETANLNGNCINDQDYGWPRFWGVPIKSIPLDLSKSCAVQGFLSLFREGIGVMIAKMIGCLAASLFEGVLNTIQPILCEAASRSMILAPPIHAQPTDAPATCEGIKNESPIQSQSFQPNAPPSVAAPTTGGAQSSGNGFASFFVGTAHAQNIGSAHSFENELKNPDSVILRIWRYARSLLNILVVIALLAIAFANILHININTYAAKKMLPGLVIGVVAANGSLLIMRFLADVTQAFSQLAVDMVGPTTTITSLIAWDFPKAVGEGAISAIIGSLVIAGGAAFFTAGLSLLGWVIVMLVLVIYYIFLVVSFVFAFVKRMVILYFLAMLAPLAFIAYGVPQFQKYFYMWWEHFLRQLFLFPILLFGMAAVVILAENLYAGDYANILNPNNFISGLVSLVLVMAAATMVLKLPKIVTKGAIDVMETFKKALGQAPRIVAGAQALHGFQYGGGKEKLMGNLASMRANVKGDSWLARARRGGKTQDQLNQISTDRLEEARKKKLVYGKDPNKVPGGKYKPMVDLLKKGRGYSTLFGRPELLGEAWSARTERAQKDDYIAAMTKTDRLPGKLRGAAAEAEIAKKLALEELKEARTMAEFRDWRDGLGEGHLKAVYNPDDDSKNLWKHIMAAAGNDAEKAEKMRQKLGSITSEDAMLSFIEKEVDNADPLGGGLGIANRWDIHDLMKVSGYEKKMTEAAKRRVSAGGDVAQRMRVDPDGNRGGAVPFAGGQAQTAPNPAAVASFTDEAIQKRITEIFNHGLTLDPNMKSELQERLVQNLDVLNDLEQMNPTDGVYASALDKTRQTLLEAIGNTASAEADQLREAIRQANDPAQLTRLTENLSIAASARNQGGDLRESVASIVAQANQGTREFHQAHSELVGQADLTKLEAAITNSLQAGGLDMAEILGRELGGGIDKLSKTLGKQLDPEEQRRLFQQMATQIQGSMVGPGQKSLRAVLQNSLQSLPKTFAKTIGVHTLQPKAMEVQIVNPTPQAPPPTPPPTAQS